MALSDVETCAFARVVSPLIEKNACIFFTGTRVAPGGYAWVFPRAVGEANVGLGISGNNSEPGKAKQYLERFIESEFPGARISNLHCGGVPVARYIRPLVKDGAMLVGDAARQVNSLSGAGLAYSLYAGKLAGKTAADAINGNTVNYKHLKTYEKTGTRNSASNSCVSYSLKKFVEKYGDDSFWTGLHNPCPKRILKIELSESLYQNFSGHPLLLIKAISYSDSSRASYLLPTPMVRIYIVYPISKHILCWNFYRITNIMFDGMPIPWYT